MPVRNLENLNCIHSPRRYRGEIPFLWEGNTGFAQETNKNFKMMVQFLHVRSTCRVLGCFSQPASQAVCKKEHKSMFWWENINGGYRQKRFLSFSGGKSRLFHSLSWYMTNLLLRGFLSRLPSVRKRSRYPAKTLQISLRNVSNLSHPLKFFSLQQYELLLSKQSPSLCVNKEKHFTGFTWWCKQLRLLAASSA